MSRVKSYRLPEEVIKRIEEIQIMTGYNATAIVVEAVNMYHNYVKELKYGVSEPMGRDSSGHQGPSSKNSEG